MLAAHMFFLSSRLIIADVIPSTLFGEVVAVVLVFSTLADDFSLLWASLGFTDELRNLSK